MGSPMGLQFRLNLGPSMKDFNRLGRRILIIPKVDNSQARYAPGDGQSGPIACVIGDWRQGLPPRLSMAKNLRTLTTRTG